ncbi:MAG TPA: TIGR03668 family PPOX class F420-dependent oxidoreductase [Acidimicrobiia bacterium]|nr:TIGR03668 family PPOX class F420-dependent oxidoreductase [Acidimicrobiia bacterium]
MDRAEALDRLERARVGRFASVVPDGRPHVVAVTFAVTDGTVVHMIDHKPKTTRNLQRLRNVETTPEACLLVDGYDEDWSALWWVRVDGMASVETEGGRWETARAALAAKYHQYRDAPPTGPALFLSMDRVTHWASS